MISKFFFTLVLLRMTLSIGTFLRDTFHGLAE